MKIYLFIKPRYLSAAFAMLVSAYSIGRYGANFANVLVVLFATLMMLVEFSWEEE